MTVDAPPRIRVVGELACHRNSYLRTLDTVVVACVEMSSQKHKKTSNGGMTETPHLWEIEFADSVFFPEGTSHS